MDEESLYSDLLLNIKRIQERLPELAIPNNLNNLSLEELKSVNASLTKEAQLINENHNRKTCLLGLLLCIEFYFVKILNKSEYGGLSKRILLTNPTSIQLFMYLDQYYSEILEYDQSEESKNFIERCHQCNLKTPQDIFKIVTEFSSLTDNERRLLSGFKDCPIL